MVWQRPSKITQRRIVLAAAGAVFACGLLITLRAASLWAASAGDQKNAAVVQTAPSATAYKAMGSPREPKVQVHWDRYHDYAEATKILQSLAKAHPERAKLRSLGKSYGGREMWEMTITDDVRSGGDRAKPAMWIDGGIHANEIQSVEVVLYTAWYLLESDGESPQVRQLLKDRVFYLVPMMSPDSRDAHFHRPNNMHSPRTGQRPVDEDKDGLVDEDSPDDLDGDGNITQMRVRDPNGKFKPHPDYPDWMVRVKDGEKGEYTLLGTEGYDNDGDGLVNEDEAGGYDPNRNWPWLWEPDYVQPGAHRYPLSILEDRMVADFIADHPNIIGAQSYHNCGGMILRAPGIKADRVESSDDRLLLAISQQGEQILPKYRAKMVGPELYEVYGGELDWLYQMRGVFALTNEVFTPFNLLQDAASDGQIMPREDVTRAFDKFLLLGEGFVHWHEVKHPQFGKIEVGGIKKNWGRQPPAFMLQEECHRNMAFSLYQAQQLPLVRVQSIDVKPLAGGLSQVTAIIENQRLLPTHAAVDVRRGITPPDQVSIEAPHGKVVLAQWSRDQFFNTPTEQKRHPQRVELSTIEGNSVVYVRWLISGPGPYSVEVASVKGGTNRLKSDGKSVSAPAANPE